MVIVVDARFLQQNDPDELSCFAKDVLQRLTKKHPEHEFHFFFDRPFDKGFIFSPNVTGHVVSPPAKNPLQWKYWLDLKAPRLLQKIEADVFFSTHGQCSLNTKVPQCVLVPHLRFLHAPGDYRIDRLQYLKHFTPRFLAKAGTVLAPSRFLKQVIVDHYKLPQEKIEVIYPGVTDIFKPIGFDEQDHTKDRYTSGAEYFLYAGVIHPRKNLINLLKAFSVFKRRLQSSMKLVLAGRVEGKSNEFSELLKTYKYKEDVVLAGSVEETEMPKLLASSYAFVVPSPLEDVNARVIEAMQCGVPVLASKALSIEEFTGGIGLYFDADNIEDMAQKLMRIYKDEEERKKFIEKGLVVAQRYDSEKTVDAIWNSLLRTIPV